ncbi:MAG TPA: hypothetical protein VHO48_06470 [Anaerolineaceae bacterium]|nr:hypothetical protein [Anaerolineaceae bacterium]
MISMEERMKILRMVQEGKLTAEEAAQLFEALDDTRPTEKGGGRSETPGAAGKPGGKWFGVRVTDTNTGKMRVNMRLPVGLVSAGIKMGARFAPEVQGLDPDRLMEAINSGDTGKVVDIFDDKDGEHVEVFIE